VIFHDFPNVVHMMKLIHFEGVLGEVLGHVSWESAFLGR
jgi:hypothetical protein